MRDAGAAGIAPDAMPSSDPPIHLCIVQPLGAIDALRLLDPALSLRSRIHRRGVEATIAKNRLVHDAVNVVFGAHLEFDPALRARHCCAFVNLEPLAGLEPEYLDLLHTSPVLDCDAARCAALPQAMLLRFLDEPAVRERTPPKPARDRAVDVFVAGRHRERCREAAGQLRHAGLVVTAPEGPVLGPERDALVREARVVLVLDEALDEPFASHVLALGTPVAWLGGARATAPAELESVVFGVAGVADVPVRVRSPGFAAEGERRLAAFQRAAPDDGCADLLARAPALFAAHRARRDDAPWRPTRINIGSGRDYLPGWLNVDILASAQPDALIDLGRPLALPFAFESRFAGPVELLPGHADLVFASNVLEHVPDLVRLATQVLALLRTGGDFLVEVPYELAREAWQDPTHVRAMNENSWKYFTSWFWYLGWLEHRFDLADMQYLDESLEPCGHESARFMRVLLRKVETTPAERTAARAAQADCGGLLPPLHPHRSGGVLNGPADG